MSGSNIFQDETLTWPIDKAKPILIIGANGQLGRSFVKNLQQAGQTCLAPKESECDLTDLSSIRKLISDQPSGIVINCAAYNAVDQAEKDQQLAMQVNAEAPGALAALCYKKGWSFVHYSSDYVFDGSKEGYYDESDDTQPLNVYGQSKRAGELSVLSAHPQALVFRLSWVIGPGQQNFLFKFRQWAQKNPVLKIAADETSVPTFTPTVVNVTIQALAKQLKGLYHLTNSGYASRYELAREYARIINLSNIIMPVPQSTFRLNTPRPSWSVMSHAKICQDAGITIPDWRLALKNFYLNEQAMDVS